MTGTAFIILGSIFTDCGAIHLQFDNWVIAVSALFPFIIATCLSFSIPYLFQANAEKMEFELNRKKTGHGTKYLIVGSDDNNNNDEMELEEK